MDISVPLTLEAVRLVKQMCTRKFTSTPEQLYDLFYKDRMYTRIYIYSDMDYFFATETNLKGRHHVPVTIEKAREILFIHSLET